jgi:hypothetical protein
MRWQYIQILCTELNIENWNYNSTHQISRTPDDPILHPRSYVYLKTFCNRRDRV